MNLSNALLLHLLCFNVSAVEGAKTASRDQLFKAPRYMYNEPLSLETTNVALRQSNDVISDVIVHKVRQDESKSPLRAANTTNDDQTKRSGNQQSTPTTSKDHTQGVIGPQREVSNTLLLQKQPEKHSSQGDKANDLKRSSLSANDDTTKCQISSTSQSTKLDLLPLPCKTPEKPARTKRKQKTTSTEKMLDSVARKSTQVRPAETKVKVIQSQSLSVRRSTTQPQQSEQTKPKRAPVQSTPVATNRIKGDTFTASAKGDPVKASPAKVLCKPRRQTRATLAYDRVMFFSDFFRRLEPDRRLFALPPIRRNRVYVRPRAEDASAAPVKFPKPSTTKKGRIGIVTATRNPGTKSSPFANKRRLPSHGWDQKIDLESIEADANSTAQSNQNQCYSVKQQLASSTLVQERPKQSLERSTYQEEEMAQTDHTKVLHGADTAVNTESAFTGVTKHSAKMRRRLKRKQRKRSTTASGGIEGGVQDFSTSGSEDGNLSQRGDESSRRGSKKELRPSAKQHHPTTSSTAAAVTPPSPRYSQKTQQDTDTTPHSHVNLPVHETEPKPVKSTVSDDILATRGKTVVEILSHIRELSSNPTEASISPKPDEIGIHGEENCAVSIVVDVTDDTGQRTVSDSDSKLQTATSQLTANSTQYVAVEEKETSANSFGMKAESKVMSMEDGRPRSPASASTLNRLSVEKTLGDGLLLKRSHSCSEMRRLMVLTEWEVVTTTNTEVTVTETGPSAQHVEKSVSSENETSKYDVSGATVKSGFFSETEDQVSPAHDSRSQTLGLAKNVMGHRRSKSSDNRTRRDIDTADAVEIHATNNQTDTQHASDCLVSSTESNEKHRDDPKVDNVIKQSNVDLGVPSTNDHILAHQCSEEIKNEPTNSDLSVSETRDGSEDCRMISQLLLLDERSSRSTTTQFEVPNAATYTLTKPSAVDRFRSVDETEQEEKWATGLNKDLILNYKLVDIVENICLPVVGDDLNNLDQEVPQHIREQVKSGYELNSVTVCSEVLIHEQISNEIESGRSEEVDQSRYAHQPYQFQCQPNVCEDGVTDHQRNTCSNIVKDETVRDSDEFVDSRQELQDVLTTPEATCPEQTSCDEPSLVAGNVSQPKVKEDEDSEEKEADEAENRNAESEETEEKGIQELNYSIVEKNGHICQEPIMEHTNRGNMTEVLIEHADVDDDTEEGSGQPAIATAVAYTEENTTMEHRISDAEVLVNEYSVTTVGHDEVNNAETEPPATSNDHTQCVEPSTAEHTSQASATWTDDTDDYENKNLYVSTATDTSYDENFHSVDNPMMSPTCTLDSTQHV